MCSSDLEAGDVTMLEMHGTGTALGDPIEVGAAVAVLEGPRLERPLALTAVKSRLGHAETGAGVQGMLHAWRQLSQSLANSITHLRAVNPYVTTSLDQGNVAVSLPRQALPDVVLSPTADAPCAGISSFAFQVSLGGMPPETLRVRFHHLCPAC